MARPTTKDDGGDSSKERCSVILILGALTGKSDSEKIVAVDDKVADWPNGNDSDCNAVGHLSR